jgi:arylsulfatase A-like enzyme
VHTPIQAKADYIAKWEKKSPKGTHWNPTYAAMIQSVDESVGRVMARLEELKLVDNTVLIFSSDNGGLGGYQRTEPPSPKKGFTDNAPLRGGKGTLYEGGLRVPFIVRWPGVVKPGATSSELAAHVDIYPTFLEIAGAHPKPGYALDGFSFVSVLKNPSVPRNREPIFWHFPGYLESYVHARGWRTSPAGAIHDGDFKLLEFFENDRAELYNLRDDIGEERDLAARMPDKTKELRAKLAAWRASVKAEMPTMKTEQQVKADRDGASVGGNQTKKKKAGKRAGEEP